MAELMPRPRFKPGDTVETFRGEIAKVAEVLWSYAYRMEGDSETSCYQPDEVHAQRKQRGKSAKKAK